MVKNGIKWANEGWGGIASSGDAVYIIRGDLLTAEEAERSMQPLIEFGRSAWESSRDEDASTNTTGGSQVVMTSFPSWGTFFDWFSASNVAVSVIDNGDSRQVNHIL